MTFTPEQVDLIVQRVVQQLGTKGVAIAPASAEPRHVTAAEPAAAPGVRIPGQVITQDLLAASATGAALVRIDAKALLTPSARDFIKQHSIQIVREGASSAGATTAIRWQVIVTKSTPQIAAAIEGLSALGIVCDMRLLGLPAEAAAQSISALCRAEAQQVVVFTDQPELVACLANRNDKVRAASVSDAAAAERVRQHLQGNLLTLDPTHKSIHELTSILKAFRPV
ncbi:MAG TPA: RpiB/LacA/LacB family sugar-phosphate isomerase [Planctomycetaceae bacterium]|jgi:hypothetical protein